MVSVSANGYTEYWAAIPDLASGHGKADYSHDSHAVLRFASLGDAITVTIKMPAENDRLVGTVDIAAGASGEFSLLEIIGKIDKAKHQNDTNWIESGLPGRRGIIDTRGLFISAESQNSGGDARFTAYIDRYALLNRDITTLKGKSAEGYAFTVPGRDRWENHQKSYDGRSAFDIVATEDNTKITIVPKNVIVNDNNGVSSGVYNAGDGFIITLMEGETFNGSSVEIALNDTVDVMRPDGHVGGSSITSDKPIVVMYKDDSVTDPGKLSGQDTMGDQLVPDALAGSEFIVIRGELENAQRKSEETAFITSVDDGLTTIVYNSVEYPINGKGVAIGILLEHEANYFSVKEPGQRVHLFQGTGYFDEVGGNIVPPIVCTGSQDVTLVRTQIPLGTNLIPIDTSLSTKTGDSTDQFDVSLVTRKSNKDNFEYSINGGPFTKIASSNFTEVATSGSDDWFYFSNKSMFRELLTIGYTLRIKNTTALDDGDGLFHLGVLEATSGGAKGGYFSDFASLSGEAGVNNLGHHNFTLACDLKVPLIASGGKRYTWSSPSGHMHMLGDASADNDTLYFTPNSREGTGPFEFEVEIIGKECEETKVIPLTITVDMLDEDFGGNIFMCEGETDTLNNVSSDPDAFTATDDRYTWSSDILLSDLNIMSPIFSVGTDAEFDVRYDDGHCAAEKVISVTTENCGECNLIAKDTVTICPNDEVTLGVTGRGSFVEWVYEKYGQKETLTNERPTVSPETNTEYTARYNEAVKNAPGEEFSVTTICEATTTVVVDPCLPDPDIVKAEIFDTDSDGRAETIIVTFDLPVSEYLFDFTSIDWPKEGKNNEKVRKRDAIRIDSVTVKLDLEDAFDAATEADENKPPYLDYGETSVLIEDRVGPVIVSIEKVPAEMAYFAIRHDDDSISTHRTPDTLLITLSEKVTLPAEGWESLFTLNTEDGKTIPLVLLEIPKSINEDDDLSESKQWKLVLDTSKSASVTGVGDHISFNSTTPVTDQLGNPATERFVEVGGVEGAAALLSSQFRAPVVGATTAAAHAIPIHSIPLFDESGKALNESTSQSIPFNPEWVPPVVYTATSGDDDEGECEDTQTAEPFDLSCYASLALGTYKEQGAYTVRVFIYDHLGQFITQWSQRFGACGEFENRDRIRQSAIENLFIHDLAWDLKDGEGRMGGTGVYYWQVSVRFDSGLNEKFTRKMGIVRHSAQCEEEQ
ncbi:MAG: IgGFc-binding protein [Fibrobacterales bacterium]